MSASAPLLPVRSDTRPAVVPDQTWCEPHLIQAYGAGLRRLFAWAFNPVTVPEEAPAKLRSLANRGTVVYVGRSAAVVNFLFLQHLLLRVGAPVCDAVLGLAVSVWRPWGRLYAGRKVVRAPGGADVVGAVQAGRSAMVFLRKPGSRPPRSQHPRPLPGVGGAQEARTPHFPGAATAGLGAARTASPAASAGHPVR